jgi:ubiquinone biosynthesis protein
MGLSLKPERLKRYRDVARLLWKHGRSDLVTSAGLETVLAEDLAPEMATQETAAEAEDLARDLEKMGPTFIKLGQLLSTRADLFPAAYLRALARLQDRVEPVPFEQVADIVRSELGMPLSVAFARFDPQPLAAASLGQVHHAVLPDGRPVAVKVQRPGVREMIAQDLEALRDIAEFLDKHTEIGRKYRTEGILEEFRRALVNELDYREEARNLVLLATNLESFQRIVVPLPVEGYTTSRVLTMDYIRGGKISALALLVRRNVDGAELAEELFRAYLKQVLVDGFFHADPHPGNLFLTDDGRIALLDLGMVARVTPEMQDKLVQWLLAAGEGHGEDAANVAVAIGKPREDFDAAEFRRRVADLVVRNAGTNMADMDSGRILLEATRIAGDCGLDIPRELTMLGKALLNLDAVGRVLDPQFDPNAAVRRNAADITQQRFRKSLAPANLFKSMIEMKELVSKLPSRVAKIVETVANNELELKVDAIDEERLIAGLQKIANRITVGLVIAAMLISAALLVRVPSGFSIFDHPSIATVLFLAAAAGGITLVITILVSDRKPRSR